jgi:DNA-binding transcriptional ArsR family regulator
VESLQALADPVRQAIVESLAVEPASVGVLAERFPISRPAVSRHLRLLKQAGLVESVTEGTKHVYRVRPQGVSALREYLDQLWRDAAARYTLVVENVAEAVVENDAEAVVESGAPDDGAAVEAGPRATTRRRP